MWLLSADNTLSSARLVYGNLAKAPAAASTLTKALQSPCNSLTKSY